MYFLNIEALKRELASGSITEKQSFYYLLISVVLYTLAAESSAYLATDNPNYLDYLDSALGIAVSTLGVLLMFLCNGGAKGEDFATRFFSIGVVVGLRFALALGLSGLLFLVSVRVFDLALSRTSEVTSWTDVLVANTVVLLLYWRMCHHLAEVRQTSQIKAASH